MAVIDGGTVHTRADTAPIAPSRRFTGCSAMVTGAGTGVGRAVAIALAREGAAVALVGRSEHSLLETIAASGSPESSFVSYPADISTDAGVELLAEGAMRTFNGLDVLVHSAGVISEAPMHSASMQDFDAQYVTNLRGPYAVTKAMLPLLRRAKGQIVFINSSVGVSAARADIGQYAATKHGLRAVADCLRQEVNGDGIRVVSVYPGRIATPMQERLCHAAGKPYNASVLIQPDDVAFVILSVLTVPRTAEVTDLHMRPMIKS